MGLLNSKYKRKLIERIAPIYPSQKMEIIERFGDVVCVAVWNWSPQDEIPDGVYTVLGYNKDGDEICNFEITIDDIKKEQRRQRAMLLFDINI